MNDWRNDIIKGIRDCCNVWNVEYLKATGNKQIRYIALDKGCVSIFTCDDREYDINVDAFVQLLFKGEIIKCNEQFVKDFWKEM